ncbi:MAG: tRNA pseudouridine(38-40) synthase TruA [Rhodobacteraceae bacterium]|nr:tRNA pseudouridine(38-40) synthase TruA [Paracoccaceae bacterium]
MPRFALKVEYHGAPYSGWQRQVGPPSVQARLEGAIRKLQADAPGIAAAGRTDAGVHARGQVAHVDLSRDWDPFRLMEALNAHLRPDPVAVLAAARVDDDWHARFSARERHYEYRIICRRAPLAIDAGLAWRLRNPLDVAAMQEGANHLIGQHDFTTFRSTMCQAQSPVKSLDVAVVTEGAVDGAQEILLTFRARSFLHNQVRSFVGTLERVGAGAWQAADVASALQARDRAACGPVAPPHGLTLREVGYPDDPFA